MLNNLVAEPKVVRLMSYLLYLLLLPCSKIMHFDIIVVLFSVNFLIVVC